MLRVIARQLAIHRQRQTRAPPKVLGCSYSVLPDYQEPVRFGTASSCGSGAVPLHLSGLRWPVPDFSTTRHRQRNLQVQAPYRSSQAGLHLLVDSTGIKFLGEGESKCKKHGAERRRQWRKLHIGIDAQTLQIRAIFVTDNDVTHAAVVPDLLAQVPAGKVL